MFNLFSDLYLPNMTVCQVRKGNEFSLANNSYLNAAREADVLIFYICCGSYLAEFGHARAASVLPIQTGVMIRMI